MQRDSGARASQRFDLARAVTLAAPLLGLATFALLKWAGWGSERDIHALGGARELAVWQFLLTAQVVVWSVLAGAGLRAVKALNAHAQAWLAETAPAWRARWRKETARFLLFSYSVVAVLLVAGGLAGLRNPYVMTGQDWKIPLLHVIAGAAAFPFLVVLKRVQLCATEETGWSTTAIVYGAWFTGVLAAIYLHVFTALDGRARSVLERAAPLPDPNLGAAEAFATGTKLRGELSAELELGGDPRKNLEGLIAVLSPLGGALLTRLGGL